jgi:hypothetical protein
MAAGSDLRDRRAGKIAELLSVLEQKIDKDVKFSVADYIRLLQAQQEYDQDTPRDIEVTWVDSLRQEINDSEI